MSFDVFAIDIPAGAKSVDDIPRDFKAAALGPRAWVLQRIREAAPEAVFDDAGCADVEIDGGSVRINAGNVDPVDCVAFYVHGDAEQPLFLIADILAALNVRAAAPGTDSGLFAIDKATDAFRRWRAFRDSHPGDRDVR